MKHKTMDKFNCTQDNKKTEEMKRKTRTRHCSDITQHLHRHLKKGTPDWNAETFPENDRSSLQQCTAAKSPLHALLPKRQESRLLITSHTASSEAAILCQLNLRAHIACSPCGNDLADERAMLINPRLWILSLDSSSNTFVCKVFSAATLVCFFCY